MRLWTKRCFFEIQGGLGPETKKFVYNGQFIDFMDFWALPGDSWFVILLDEWNSPYKIVPYDTYIIFEQHLGAI